MSGLVTISFWTSYRAVVLCKKCDDFQFHGTSSPDLSGNKCLLLSVLCLELVFVAFNIVLYHLSKSFIFFSLFENCSLKSSLFF